MFFVNDSCVLFVLHFNQLFNLSLEFCNQLVVSFLKWDLGVMVDSILAFKVFYHLLIIFRHVGRACCLVFCYINVFKWWWQLWWFWISRLPLNLLEFAFWLCNLKIRVVRSLVLKLGFAPVLRQWLGLGVQMLISWILHAGWLFGSFFLQCFKQSAVLVVKICWELFFFHVLVICLFYFVFTVLKFIN